MGAGSSGAPARRAHRRPARRASTASSGTAARRRRRSGCSTADLTEEEGGPVVVPDAHRVLHPIELRAGVGPHRGPQDEHRRHRDESHHGQGTDERLRVRPPPETARARLRIARTAAHTTISDAPGAKASPEIFVSGEQTRRKPASTASQRWWKNRSSTLGTPRTSPRARSPLRPNSAVQLVGVDHRPVGDPERLGGEEQAGDQAGARRAPSARRARRSGRSGATSRRPRRPGPAVRPERLS